MKSIVRQLKNLQFKVFSLSSLHVTSSRSPNSLRVKSLTTLPAGYFVRDFTFSEIGEITRKLGSFIKKIKNQMEGLSELEWVELGEKVKLIRDRLMDACILCCNRFGKTGLYPTAKRLDSAFLTFRSKLDDFVCGAYPMNKHNIGPQNTAITHVFFGDSSYRPHVVEIFGRKYPKCFTEEQMDFLRVLISNLEEIIPEVLNYPYLAWGFDTYKEIIKNLKKRTRDFRNKLQV